MQLLEDGGQHPTEHSCVKVENHNEELAQFFVINWESLMLMGYD